METKQQKGALKEPVGGGELELYLHIPFCVKKCAYCDFLSAPRGRQEQERYVQALCREIQSKAKWAKTYTVSSIFLGGGTPSLLTGEDVRCLMEEIYRDFAVDDGAEITLEANPGTVDRQKLVSYRQAGINRLSMGLQSAKEGELRMLGRIHSLEQFLVSYRMAAEEGFDNLNVDLMSALPGQTPESYRETLECVLQLAPAPKHISAYSLIVEEGTALYERQAQGLLTLPSEEEEREMYALTEKVLRQAGYERYEISNYAKPGYACRHNIGYWNRTPYLGLGIGAASLFEERRFANQSDFAAYLEHPEESGGEVQALTIAERMEETMFLGLRMMRGVSEQAFLETFGRSVWDVYGEVIRRCERDGLLSHKEGRIFLTPYGIDVSNYVMAQFLF